MSEPSDDSPPRKGRARIAASEASVDVVVTIPSDRFDLLYARARVAHVSVAELVRRELDRARRFERLLIKPTTAESGRASPHE